MTSFPESRRKLDEAQHFLAELERASSRIPARPEEFRHNLSAFLNAARSVTWVMQKEARDVYERVFGSWSQSLSADDRDLMKFMNEERVKETKREGSQPIREQRKIRAELVPGVTVSGPPAPLVAEKYKKQTGKDIPDELLHAYVIVDDQKYDIGGRKILVTDACRRYVGLLKDVEATVFRA